MKIELELPWPPSVNSYWRRNGHVYFISQAGKNYRQTVDEYVRFMGLNMGSSERLRVEILAAPPDRRTRDLDNILKSLFDSLDHADVFMDDGQIDQITVERLPISKPGYVKVKILELGN